jgi:DNA-binding transcriptional LysR family regulator
MDFRQLKALLAIADTGSMTKAAEMLNIVQPAVSRQLKLLEEDVGVVLFERHRMGMQLTPDGEILAAYARRVYRNWNAPAARSGPASMPCKVRCLLACYQALPNDWPAHWSAVARKNFRDTSAVSGWLCRSYADMAGTGETDLALLYYPHPSALLHLTPVLEEQLWVAAPPDSRLNADQPLPLHALADKP